MWRLAWVIVFASGPDASPANVGLHSIATQLHATLATAQWATSDCLLALAASPRVVPLAVGIAGLGTSALRAGNQPRPLLDLTLFGQPRLPGGDRHHGIGGGWCPPSARSRASPSPCGDRAGRRATGNHCVPAFHTAFWWQAGTGLGAVACSAWLWHCMRTACHPVESARVG